MEILRRIALVLLLAPLGLTVHTVQAAQSSAQPASGAASSSATPAKAAAKSSVKAKAKKPVRKSRTAAKATAKDTRTTVSDRIDLSLPKEMVRQLKPEVDSSPTAKTVQTPLLPAMFPDTPSSNDSSFQLNGRLISNEMQLQLRNDSRRDLEGAAIEFQFRQ
ncbi:hypothetical protein [Pseudomonas sp.]|uniref:hypothetical protein n=1 Tax=Pseudomonas sp. TaxID=306 RepID=UPI0028AB9FCA|nr:hypothetical protein [Pseudomonas sp.]